MEFIKTNPNIDLYENVVETTSQVVTHLVIPRGKEIAEHHAPYDVIVVPIKGAVIFGDVAGNREEKLVPGDLVKMKPNEHHYLKAVEDAEVIVIKSKLA
ncbi:cupin [Limosilactobacillus caviae]|uniref:Cupin n=1 Tax=Limosilactobacillus caviae TaxID=1769424 RepID=A0ABQ2C1D2_9LACO|nr:cupin [Limosilactobacillus caviae]MCD7124693.1 cupin [Limosilactobacillus caviae]MRH45663.1 cupin [Limosilactobacillus reuteri]GGI62206.1 hypothetical protein GCM10011459_00400 [Limosilactobacillus caviae]